MVMKILIKNQENRRKAQRKGRKIYRKPGMKTQMKKTSISTKSTETQVTQRFFSIFLSKF